ncbi:Ost6 protein [Candida orthopsilosis Co 90-125]|uniref:Ost6 protein n=1 Tax=Candida orthopsilosis (strain 90-125) TaxID=1136231 RepID=H8X3Z0_CANO9|nr:Ost6 protein [Candida orthopsilosis Co 90-125]CCG25778.1 Ost6 protein [Candida orthopsilosis Co 90-125]
MRKIIPTISRTFLSYSVNHHQLYMRQSSPLPLLWIILSLSILLLLPQTVLAYDHNTENDEGQIIIDIHNGDLSQLSGHRDYYTVLIFTSSNPAHDCKPCEQVIPMAEQVATTYLAKYITSELLSMRFYNIDLNDISNAGIFRELKMDNIPHVWLVPPSSRTIGAVSGVYEDGTIEHVFDSPHLKYSLKKASLERQVVEFARFLSEILMIDLHVDDAVAKKSGSGTQSSLSTFAKTFIITFTIVVLIKKKGPSFISNTSRKTVVCYFAITIILLCVGGSQFSIQRQSPLITKDEATGGLVFISGGSMHYQYGIEVFIVGLNYASLAASVIGLIKLGSYQVTESSKIRDETSRTWLIILVSLVIYYLYSCLTSILLKKDPGYPYPFTKLF